MKELVTMLRRAAMVFGLVGILAVGYRVVLSEQEGSLTESPDAVLSPREMVPTAADLDEIVLTSDNVPEGWVIQATRPGRVALDYLIRYGQVRHATTGFVDARATTFCAEGEGCGTSWIAQYRSEGDAEAAVSVFRSEMVVGWGMGAHSEPLGFEQDQGYVFMNNLGNAAANQAYLWRTGNLVLGMLAIGDMEIAPLRLLAEQMNTRSR